MNNCLVTKLKGVVNNDNLDYLGCMVFNKTTAIGLGRVELKSATNSVTCKIIGEGHFTNETGAQDLGKEQTKTHTDLANARFFVSSDTTKVLAKDKYNLITVNIRYDENPNAIACNIEDLENVEGLQQLNVCKSNSYGNISKLNKQSFTSINLWTSNVSGNIYEVIQNSINTLTYIQLNSNVTVEGPLSPMQLYSMIPNLISIQVYTTGQLNGNFELLGNTPLNRLDMATASSGTTGTIEQFVANKRTAGMTTGSLTFNGAGRTSVTYNGNPITQTDITVTWTADSITVA